MSTKSGIRGIKSEKDKVVKGVDQVEDGVINIRKISKKIK